MRTALHKVKRLVSGHLSCNIKITLKAVTLYFRVHSHAVIKRLVSGHLSCYIKITLKAVTLYFRVHSHAVRTGFCCIYSAVCVYISVYKKIVEAHNIYHRGPGFLCTLLTGSPNLYMYN
jgi:hypothetical protein